MLSSSDIYKIVAEHAVDPIFLTDTEGNVIYANPAAEKVFGYSEQEFAGKRLHDVIHHHHPDGTPFPASECRLFQAYTSGETVEDEVATFIRKDGTPVTMSGSSTPVEINGRRECRLFFARDVSTRVAAEQALAESEQRLRLITDSMPQPVWVLAPDGTMSFANARFWQFLGMEPKVGVDYVTPVHPDDVSRTQEAIAEAMRTGNDYRIEHRAKAVDGSYHWFLTHGVPLRGPDGKVLGLYGSSTDIDDIKRATDALHRSQETLRLAVEATNLGTWEYYTQTGELIWSDTNRRLYGVPAEGEMTYPMFIDRVHPEDRARIDNATRKLIMLGRADRFDAQFRIFRLNDCALRWLRVNGQALIDDAGKAVRFVGTTFDITNTKLAEQRIREASQRDSLTGLPNRALLFEYIDHLLAVAQRTRRNGALLFIDLDHFKPINDTHGHDVGDQVLKQVAKRLLACTRHEDVVGRLGGDEFVVALPHPDDVHGPATVAHHIVERVSQPYYVADLQLHLSPSIGISLYPIHGEDIDTLIKRADSAMYEAKNAGRKCYKFYTPDFEAGVDQRLGIELRLRQALERNELTLLYQPIVELQSGNAVGAEALLRLPMPHGEPLLPPQFMHIAEGAGLINQLGEWVVREACHQQRRWCRAGLPSMTISVNIAPQQFRQHAFVRYLLDSIRHCGMDPAHLQIELKESTVLEDLHDTLDALKEIRGFGIRVALDDFGLGYSSVGLLSSMPLDLLKLDQSFVHRIGHDTKSQTITDSVLALGHSLHLKVVGEGIESEQEFDYLRDHGCDHAQGFYFSKPLAAEEFEHWFRYGQVHAHAVH